MDRPIPSAIPKNDLRASVAIEKNRSRAARALILIKGLYSSHRDRQLERRRILPMAKTTGVPPALRLRRRRRRVRRCLGLFPFFLRLGTLLAVRPAENLTSLRPPVTLAHRSTPKKDAARFQVICLSFQSYPITMETSLTFVVFTARPGSRRQES
jgi:hypothetical protein